MTHACHSLHWCSSGKLSTFCSPTFPIIVIHAGSLIQYKPWAWRFEWAWVNGDWEGLLPWIPSSSGELEGNELVSILSRVMMVLPLTPLFATTSVPGTQMVRRMTGPVVKALPAGKQDSATESWQLAFCLEGTQIWTAIYYHQQTESPALFLLLIPNLNQHDVRPIVTAGKNHQMCSILIWILGLWNGKVKGPEKSLDSWLHTWIIWLRTVGRAEQRFGADCTASPGESKTRPCWYLCHNLLPLVRWIQTLIY